MPLPVERSQGSVSALVARFQVAANRDAEQGRRMSLPPPSSTRRNSSLGVSPNVTGNSNSGTSPTPKAQASLPELDGSGLPAAGLGDKEKAGTRSGSLGAVDEKEEAKSGGAGEWETAEGKIDPKEAGEMAPKEFKGSVEGPTYSDESPVKVTETLKSKVHEVKEAVKETIIGGASPAKEFKVNDDGPGAKGNPQTPSKAKATAKPAPMEVTASSMHKNTKSASLSKTTGTPAKVAKAASSPTASKTPLNPSSSPTAEKKAKPTNAPAMSPTTSTRKRLDSSKSQSSTQPKTPTKASSSAMKSKAETASAQPTKVAAKSATSNAAVTVLPRSNSTRSASTRPLTAQSTGPKSKISTATKLTTPGPKSPEDVISPLRPQLTGHTASSLAKTRTPVSEKLSHSKATMSLGRAAGTKVRPKPSSPTPAGPVGDRKSTSTPSRMTTSASSSRLMQGTAASRGRAADSPARKDPATPSKTGSVKVKRPMGTTPSKTGKGDEDVGTVSLHGKPVGSISGAPPGARLGLAGAGIGQGGKMGKELNDETNAKLRLENGQDRRETSVIPAPPISRQSQIEHNDLDASADELLGRPEIQTGHDTTTKDTREITRGVEQGRGLESVEKGQGKEGEQMVEVGSEDLEAVDQESQERNGVKLERDARVDETGEEKTHARNESLDEIPDVI